MPDWACSVWRRSVTWWTACVFVWRRILVLSWKKISDLCMFFCDHTGLWGKEAGLVHWYFLWIIGKSLESLTVWILFFWSFELCFLVAQAPFVAGQLDFCLQHPEVYTPVLVGFNPSHQARCMMYLSLISLITYHERLVNLGEFVCGFNTPDVNVSGMSPYPAARSPFTVWCKGCRSLQEVRRPSSSTQQLG